MNGAQIGNTRRGLLRFGSATLLAGFAARPGRAAETYTLRLSTWGSPTAPQVSVFVPNFQKFVSEGSKGQINVQAFPAGALVKEQDVPSAIQSRVVDISLSTVGAWASISKPAALLNSILFRPTDADFLRLTGSGSALFKALDTSLRQRGVALLAVLDNGPPMVTSRSKLTSPADFKGKSIRVYDRASAEIIRTLGAAPSTMPVSDVYPALQRGTVQAAIGGLQGIIGLKEYEVAKYLLNGNGVWGVGTTLYVMNADALKQLPADLQTVVLDAAGKAGATTNDAIFNFIAKGFDELRQHGMEITMLKPDTPSYEAFSRALSPLAKAQRAHMPEQLVAQVLNGKR